jgi:hypothetical protein
LLGESAKKPPLKSGGLCFYKTTNETYFEISISESAAAGVARPRRFEEAMKLDQK